MKKLLIILGLAALMIPSFVLAGNVAPTLYLEVSYQTYDPEEAPPPVIGPEICAHVRTYPVALQCFAPRLAFTYYIVPIHVGKLDMPICQTTGPSCEQFGGYLGLGFGITLTNNVGVVQTTPSFMSWNACPGFLKGPSAAGEPAACIASSTALCHDWPDHEGYLLYNNLSGSTERRLNIVASADLGHYKVINCHNQYDNGTVIGHGVQIGGAQTIVCGESPTAVTETTWGAIKGLYR